MSASWGRTVESSRRTWTVSGAVDGVDNRAGLSTGSPARTASASPVFLRFPRTMKMRMKK